MVPVGVLDRMNGTVDMSASEALSADMEAEDEGVSEVDMMPVPGLDIPIMGSFYR